MCLAHAHSQLQSTGSESVGLGPLLACLSLCKTGVQSLDGKAVEGGSAQNPQHHPQPPAHQAPLSHTPREKTPETGVASRFPPDPTALTPQAPHMLPSPLATEWVASAARLVAGGNRDLLRTQSCPQEELPASQPMGDGAAGRGQWHPLLSPMDAGPHSLCHKSCHQENVPTRCL